MFVLLALWFQADVGDPQVYFGKLAGAKSPGEVVAKSAFAEIPDYKEIKEKGLTKDDPEYWILLSKANDKFYAAVKKVGEENKFDVIVEKGTAKLETAAPDVTRKVIAALTP